MKNHNEILSSGGLDNYSNYMGEVLPDNFVNVIGQHRDSDCLARCNFEVALKMLGGESDSVQILSVNHWACGWIDEIFVDSNDSEKMAIAEKIREDLENYPSLDDNKLSEMEQEEANEIWKNCYNVQDRIDYIREHESQFEFRSLADMIGCVRGNYFAGYASELIYR